ncbi:MAG TPA: hypothetical protein VMZ53_09185 [Kofleriaceae bacterium]|nr:hypothetical protein [Kofleriaceae bacterium]
MRARSFVRMDGVLREAGRLVAIGGIAGLAGCSDGPSARIIVPLPDTTVYASVELRMEGHKLERTTQTKIYVDLTQYTGELIDNSLPSDCDDCNFVIGFAGPTITNGAHTISAHFYDGEVEIASDSVPLVFAR